MDTGTVINERPRSQNNQPRFTGGFDMPLLVCVVALIVFGLIMLYSASWDFSFREYDNEMRMFPRQVTWLGLGLAAAIFLAFFDYHYCRKLALPAMLVTISLLAAVLSMTALLGSRRWFLNGSGQPSEFAKLVLIIYLSVWLYSKKQFLQDVSLGLFPLGIILGIVGGGGIGFLLISSIRAYEFQLTLTIIIAIFAIVLVIEWLGLMIKRLYR